jgi:hypothetical protein
MLKIGYDGKDSVEPVGKVLELLPSRGFFVFLIFYHELSQLPLKWGGGGGSAGIYQESPG